MEDFWYHALHIVRMQSLIQWKDIAKAWYQVKQGEVLEHKAWTEILFCVYVKKDRTGENILKSI